MSDLPRRRWSRAPGLTGAESGRDRPGVPANVWEMEIEDLAAVFALGERIFRADPPILHPAWDDSERTIAFFEREGFAEPVRHVYLSRNLTLRPGYRRRRRRDDRAERD